jgi:hypothetical protein
MGTTRKHDVAALGLMSLLSTVACADASYQQTSQITGGALTDTIRSISFLGKSTQEMLAPTNSLTMVHGNQKVVINKNSTEIIDLDKETITRIDTEKKTYTIMTFAQMRQAAADMMKRIQQTPAKQAPAAQQPKSDLKTSFEVTVKNTDLRKSVNGLDAQEQVVEMQMHVTDPNGSGTEAQNTITYTVTTDAWIAPDPPEVKEIQNFDVHMAKKMMEGADLSAFMNSRGANPGLAQMFGGKPGTAEAMTQMQKEMAKLKGTRVMEVTRMGGDAPGGAQTTAGTTPVETSTGPSVPTQVATDTATQTAASQSSKFGAFGSALTNSVVGAFRRQPATRPTPSPAPAPATTAEAAQPTTRVVLMEMTMQKSNFSQEAIPPSAFEVPNGFKRIPFP